MTNKYKVIWSKTAEKDLERIIEYYIAMDSVSNAKKILSKLKQQSSQLTAYPERGRIIPELSGFNILQYREIIETPWRIIYRISREDVYVLSIIDSRRNVEDILLDRLVKT